MIELHNVSKGFGTGSGRTTIADSISVRFRSGRAVALLGSNGAGKSSLLKIIAGTMEPDSGHVHVTGRVSWPVGFAGSFHGDLTGAQNTRFLARVYGVDTQSMEAAVASFAELGPHFSKPVRTYSAGMKARLAFGTSMAIPFDTYLVDEVTSVGDAQFKEKSKRVFLDRLTRAGAIVVSHTLPFIREVCDEAAVLEKGRLTHYRDVEAAIDHHLALSRPNAA